MNDTINKFLPWKVKIRENLTIALKGLLHFGAKSEWNQNLGSFLVFELLMPDCLKLRASSRL